MKNLDNTAPIKIVDSALYSQVSRFTYNKKIHWFVFKAVLFYRGSYLIFLVSYA